MATSRGTTETRKLMNNLEEQLDRLVSQLADLEECRDDLEHDEYEETKQETMDQLREFKETLDKLSGGDMSLVSGLGAMQLAIQAAISEAFRTPEIIRMFAKKQPGQLRRRLEDINRDRRMNKLSDEAASSQIVEILSALRQLGETLSPDELSYLETHRTHSLQFAQVSNSPAAGDKVLKLAGSEVEKASGH